MRSSKSTEPGTKRSPLVIVVSGPGGVGKGTIVARLMEVDDHLWLSRSWTTRAQRPGEADDAYEFVDRATFEAGITADDFLEWAEFAGNLYGTPWPSTESGGADVVLEIDVQGARAVRSQDPEALLIFIDAPHIEGQRERLRGRGDPESAVEQRVHEGLRERGEAAELNAIVVINDELDRAVNEVLGIIESHRCRES